MLKHEARSRGRLPPASVFAALGDPLRLAMVARLCHEGPLPTIHLQTGAGGSRQAITKHLRVLEAAGLVSSDRIGRDRQWQMRTKQLMELRDYLEQISAVWDRRIERLRLFVEG
jgi:DNA-binding transcriptional ArsR family regulator